MRKLYIVGKANSPETREQFAEPEAEVWMLGTDDREGADRYFELHGIKVKHENTAYELPDAVYNQGLPINNSICALLVYEIGRAHV